MWNRKIKAIQYSRLAFLSVYVCAWWRWRVQNYSSCVHINSTHFLAYNTKLFDLFPLFAFYFAAILLLVLFLILLSLTFARSTDVSLSQHALEAMSAFILFNIPQSFLLLNKLSTTCTIQHYSKSFDCHFDSVCGYVSFESEFEYFIRIQLHNYYVCACAHGMNVKQAAYSFRAFTFLSFFIFHSLWTTTMTTTTTITKTANQPVSTN